jgi:hypothetical protein
MFRREIGSIDGSHSEDERKGAKMQRRKEDKK